MDNLLKLMKYMIENKLFESKEEAMNKAGVLFMLGQMSQDDLVEVTSEIKKVYAEVHKEEEKTSEVVSGHVEQPTQESA